MRKFFGVAKMPQCIGCALCALACVKLSMGDRNFSFVFVDPCRVSSDEPRRRLTRGARGGIFPDQKRTSSVGSAKVTWKSERKKIVIRVNDLPHSLSLSTGFLQGEILQSQASDRNIHPQDPLFLPFQNLDPITPPPKFSSTNHDRTQNNTS